MSRPEGEGITLRGKAYWLRTLSQSDVTDRYLGWLRDPEVARFLGTVPFTDHSPESVTAFVASFDNRTSYLFGIFPRESGEHVGNITLRTDPNHRIGWHGTMIGDKRYWGRNAAIEAQRILLEFAFDQLDLRKVYSGVNIRHTAAIFNLRRLGYKEEARLREHFIFEGDLVDFAYYTLFRETWRSLEASRQSNQSPQAV